MNRNRIRISEAFDKGKALIVFLTAGDPTLKKTEEYILAMAGAGADLIEVGIPFSDPIAEGEVILRANTRALQEGATTDRIFEMVESIRTETDIPLVFLTYMNPVFVYGIDRFFMRCNHCGISGIIIPDLPFEEKDDVRMAAQQNHVDVITMIAPTSGDRIEMLASKATGFIYLVSSMGVTGVRKKLHIDLQSIASKIRKCTDTKIAIGFGISTPEQALEVCTFADGVIVGSAIVSIIEKYGENAGDRLIEYIREMKRPLV